MPSKKSVGRKTKLFPRRRQANLFRGGMKVGNPYPGQTAPVAPTGGGMKGAGWWDDFKSGFNMVMEPATKAFKTVAPFIPGAEMASPILSAFGYGRKRASKARASHMKLMPIRK